MKDQIENVLEDECDNITELYRFALNYSECTDNCVCNYREQKVFCAV